jgi:hypothetical protein
VHDVNTASHVSPPRHGVPKTAKGVDAVTDGADGPSNVTMTDCLDATGFLARRICPTNLHREVDDDALAIYIAS